MQKRLLSFDVISIRLIVGVIRCHCIIGRMSEHMDSTIFIQKIMLILRKFIWYIQNDYMSMCHCLRDYAVSLDVGEWTLLNFVLKFPDSKWLIILDHLNISFCIWLEILVGFEILIFEIQNRDIFSKSHRFIHRK